MNVIERSGIVFEPRFDAVERDAEGAIGAAIDAADREIDSLAAYRDRPGRSIAIHAVANDVANTLARIIEYERVYGTSATTREWRRRSEKSIARYLPLAISRK